MLKNFWDAVEETGNISNKPKRVTVLGQDLAVFRQSNGKIAVHSTALLEIQGAIVTINGRVVQPGPNPI